MKSIKTADINPVMKQNRRKSTKKTSSRPGCLFWIALILLVIILFLVNQKNMEKVVASTGFFNLFSKSAGKSPENTTETAKPEETIQLPEVKRITGKETAAEPEKKEAVSEVQIVKASSDKPEPSEKIQASEVRAKSQDTAASFKVRDSILYFIVINEDGSTMHKKTTRSIRYTDSPLTSTMNSLLTGVSSSEINNNYISLIPEKTRLNKLWISDGTAYIDFNENFLFNSFGREGYIGQLKQIVYTATEFPTVKKVQILIDGQIKTYLGSEGIQIGKPLARESFK